MRTTKVYDLPTRLFHWLFAGLFIGAFAIAKAVDDESVVFSYHMLLGIMLGVLVFFRLVWAITGSRYARFTGFSLNPKALIEYMMGILSGSKKRWAGHNPASSWAAITMFGLVIGLVLTGYLMSTGQKEQFEDIHEFFAHTFLIVVLSHLAGVIFHSFRHKDRIALSMIDGNKQVDQNEASIPSSHLGVAGIFLAGVLLSAGYLIKNFDAQTKKLSLLGGELMLGKLEDKNENKGNEHEQGANEQESKSEKDDD